MLQNQFLIYSPLEQFEVTSLLCFNAPFLGYFTLTLTNLALYSIIILILILGIHIMGNNDKKLLPSERIDKSIFEGTTIKLREHP